MRHAFSSCLVLMMFASALIALACDDDPHIGAACEHDRHCEDGRCARGPDFPGGMCTYSCRDDRDCPSDWFCIEKAGGVCAHGCDRSHQCEDWLDSRWSCRAQKRAGGPGNIDVCVGR